MPKLKKIPKYLVVKGSKKLRRLQRHKIPLYTLIFAFRCSFKKQFFERKNTKNFSKPMIPKFLYFIAFYTTSFSKNRWKILSGSFDAAKSTRTTPNLFAVCGDYTPWRGPPISLVQSNFYLYNDSLAFAHSSYHFVAGVKIRDIWEGDPKEEEAQPSKISFLAHMPHTRWKNC